MRRSKKRIDDRSAKKGDSLNEVKDLTFSKEEQFHSLSQGFDSRVVSLKEIGFKDLTGKQCFKALK